MAYAQGSGISNGRLVVLKSSAAETSSTTHSSFATAAGEDTAIVSVVVSASSGTTPTLLVTVEGSLDGTTWFTLGTIGTNGFSVGNGTAATNLTTTNTGVNGVFHATPFVRSRSTVGGTTPSFTYSVIAQVY